MNHLRVNSIPDQPRIIVFGVSGSGKSTIAALLSHQLNVPFIEADEFHPQVNIKKMKSGIPLTDSDREPWLKALNQHMKSTLDNGFVVTCSALKERYRELLKYGIPSLCWVYLDGSFEQIYHRMQKRSHFMKPKMLTSQFDALEVPEYGIHCSIDYPPEEIVNQILKQLSE